MGLGCALWGLGHGERTLAGGVAVKPRPSPAISDMSGDPRQAAGLGPSASTGSILGSPDLNAGV